jgi:hypothetical protein
VRRALAAGFAGLALLVLATLLVAPAAGAATGARPGAVRLHALHISGADKLTVARPGARGAAAPVTLDAGARFTLAGVVCDVPPAGHRAVTLELRTSLDGRAWGAWSAVPLEVVDEAGRAQAYTDPVWTGAARYVQVRARGGARSSASLAGVRVVAIDPGASPTGGASAILAADAPTVSAARASTDQPAIVTRAQWGADESLRSGSVSYAPVKVAIVHHTASNNDYTQADAPGIVRAIYAYHTRSLHWNDIGYNFLIDRFGTVYEGRYGGISRGVVGAQAGGFNTGSTGVSVLGTFTAVAPPAAVLTSLEHLLAWKFAVAGIDPNGTAKLTCGLTDKYKYGAVVTFATISGHRDANLTECPGDRFYPLLPAIRTQVAKIMGSAPTPTPTPTPTAGPITATLSASRAAISPNGDGVLDDVQLTGTLSESADWRIVVRNGAGQSVGSWTGSGAAPAAAWKGLKENGVAVADGAYTAALTASSAAGASTTATVDVTVDTSAPRIASAAATPLTFSPDGDGQNETAEVEYRPAEACSVRVGILDTAGDVLRWLHGWRAQTAAGQSATWDGRVSSGGALVAAADGKYRFRIERKDAAGNVARNGVPIVLDRTVGFPAAAPVAFSPNGDAFRDVTVLSFKLTRKATVSVQIKVGADVVRTLALGSLAAGAHSATWDGKAGSGDVVASCRPVYVIKAVSALGESSVTKGLVVDLYAPRLYATKGLAIALGATANVSCKAADPFSAKVDISYVVTDAKGRQVKTGHTGMATTGRAQKVSWKPAARGVFTITWHAKDQAGNPEAASARTVVTVR